MTTVAELTEAEIIELLQKYLPGSSDMVELGIGDDAAVLTLNSRTLVTSTDMMIEDLDFRLSWSESSGYSQGWKAFVQNAADIFSMGATPTAMLLTLGLPPSTDVEYVKGIAQGITDCAQREYQLKDFSVIGGDLSASDKLIISVTIFGELLGNKALTRSGAKVGDVLLLAGIPGKAALGLAQLEGKFPVEHLDARSWQLQPRPPFEVVQDVVHDATAMIDTSDGLLKDAARIARASGVCLDISTKKLEASLLFYGQAATLHDTEILHMMLSGGEDHNLLFTMPAAAVPQWAIDKNYVIGCVQAGKGVKVDGQSVKDEGWEHFIS
ncbi:MAG: thiamine-phosphate kinase [Micrococcaceae bacterium]